LLIFVLLIVTSVVQVMSGISIAPRFAAPLRGELVQAVPKHLVEAWEWVDDVGERLQRSAQLDRQHELVQWTLDCH